MPLFTKDAIIAGTADYRNEKDLLCFFWHCKHGQPAWLKDGEDNADWCKELLNFRKDIVSGKCVVFKENIKEDPHECEGKKYWGLNIQYADPSIMVSDPISLMCFGFICSGHTYWFPSKGNRDNSWDLLTRGLEIKPSTQNVFGQKTN